MSVLAPFVIGVVLAYVTMPLVDWLNKWMPRPLAVALVMVTEFVVLVGFFAALIPVLVNEVGVMLNTLPGQEERQRFFNELVVQLRAVLPPAAQDFVRDSVQKAAQDIQQNAATYVSTLLGLIGNAVLGVLGTISFAVSLLVLPTWLFSVLRDRNRAVRAVNSLLPETWRADFWAPLRIADRTLGFYIRGFMVQAIAVTVGVYLGVQVLQALGYGPFRYPLLLAMAVGLTQLIPVFGPFIGYILGGLIGLSHSAESAVAVIIMLVVVQVINNLLVTSRLHKKIVDIHPAILAVLLVAGSQFGVLGVLLAAPLGIMLRDLFRYVYGRFSDPPQPAGLLPGAAGKAASRTRVVQPAQGTTQLRVPTGTGIPYRSETPSPVRLQLRE
jgi:predicted PurR-regulated permease PerM